MVSTIQHRLPAVAVTGDAEISLALPDGGCHAPPRIEHISAHVLPHFVYYLLRKDDMAPEVSLEFLIDGESRFSSSGKWLHPLFDLETFLRERSIDPSGGEIHDKVVGRGSAFLIVRMGIRTVHAGLLSRLGRDVLDRAGARVTWDTLVPEIQCATESLLRQVTDPEEAYPLLAERARRSGGARPAGGSC
jgi:hypothetical protein